MISNLTGWTRSGKRDALTIHLSLKRRRRVDLWSLLTCPVGQGLDGFEEEEMQYLNISVVPEGQVHIWRRRKIKEVRVYLTYLIDTTWSTNTLSRCLTWGSRLSEWETLTIHQSLKWSLILSIILIPGTCVWEQPNPGVRQYPLMTWLKGDDKELRCERMNERRGISACASSIDTRRTIDTLKRWLNNEDWIWIILRRPMSSLYSLDIDYRVKQEKGIVHWRVPVIASSLLNQRKIYTCPCWHPPFDPPTHCPFWFVNPAWHWHVWKQPITRSI